MNTKITREQAVALLKKYNQEPFHIQHAYTVEAVMRWFAGELGHGDEDFWGLCGLLHDVDFEKFPEEHCKKAPELLAELSAEAEVVHAVCSHGYGICSDVKPVHEMEKILFASDELTGLIGAAARMRPSKSCTDMELSSLKKKFKDKRFAAEIQILLFAVPVMFRNFWQKWIQFFIMFQFLFSDWPCRDQTGHILGRTGRQIPASF